jgi:hypothetical protein
VPLAALGLQTLWRTLARRHAALALAAVGIAVVVSSLELAIQPFEHHYRTVPVPPEYAAVEQTPRGILAEYPLGYSDIYRLWQRVHGRPLVNGAPVDTTADYARLVVLDPAEPGVARSLALMGVTAIMIHPEGRADVPVPPREPTPSEGYRLVGRYPDGASLWTVTAPPAPALVLLPGGFAAPQRVTGGHVAYALVSSSGVAALDLYAKAPALIRLTFDATPPRGARLRVRLAGGSREQPFLITGPAQISTLVQVPRGVSQLLIKVDPAPSSPADALLISAPRAEAGSGSPALQPQVTSSDPGF